MYQRLRTRIGSGRSAPIRSWQVDIFPSCLSGNKSGSYHINLNGPNKGDLDIELQREGC